MKTCVKRFRDSDGFSDSKSSHVVWRKDIKRGRVFCDISNSASEHGNSQKTLNTEAANDDYDPSLSEPDTVTVT